MGSDFEGVRRTIAQYCHLVDDARWDEWTQLFTADATFSVLGRTMKGHEELKTFISASLYPGAGKHVTVNTVIDVDGDEARSVSDFVYVAPEGDGFKIMTAGRYTDRLVREGDRWLFAAREIVLGLGA
jgi:3-phenylpropionate/cinnamic acid dioxygenase small subunit